MELEEHFQDQEVDREFITYVARKFLKDVLEQCDKKGISKQGLIREIRSGIKDDYLEQVVEEDNKEYWELYLEKMAMIGEKRIELQASSNVEKGEMEDYPVKLVEHTMMGGERL